MIGLNLRLPEELHKALKELAERESRSLNSQIIYILKWYIEHVMKESK